LATQKREEHKLEEDWWLFREEQGCYQGLKPFRGGYFGGLQGMIQRELGDVVWLCGKLVRPWRRWCP
jgi:hypothetical protein